MLSCKAMAQETLEQQLVWLLEKSRVLIGTREVARLLRISIDALLEFTGAERAFFLIDDPTTSRLTTALGKSASGDAIAAADARVMQVAGQVFKDRRSVLATDNPQQEGPLARRAGTELRLKLLVCLPLMVANEALGVLYADGKTDPVNVAHSRALELFAEHVAIALDNARMYERATNDLLTGLPNNSYFLFQLNKALKEATDANRGGVLLLDLDAFKRVNQAAGAEMGDRALIDISHTLREILRSDGLVARYGSDKFAILIPPDPTTPINLRLRDVAERARAAIGTKAYYGIALSASIGGVSFPATSTSTSPPGVRQTAPDVIAMADDILARARNRGQGQLEIG